MPGKNLLRATGPFQVLKLVAKGAGVEIINSKGRIITVAKSNLRPYNAEVVSTKGWSAEAQMDLDEAPDISVGSKSEDEDAGEDALLGVEEPTSVGGLNLMTILEGESKLYGFYGYLNRDD